MSTVLPLHIGTELRAPAAPEDEALVSFDVRRPWPRGVPSSDEALAVLAEARHLDDELIPVHCTVAAKLPEEIRGAARAHLRGLEAPLAEAAAAAWRALVAVELAARALGLDQGALLDLIGVTVTARERLRALRVFSFGSGLEFDALDAELGRALDRLVEEARFRAEPTAQRRTPTTTEKPTFRSTSAGPYFRVALLLTLLFASVVQLAGRAGESRREAWVLVGSLESGHAFLAPTTARPDEEALRRHLREFEARGYVATRTPSGEWSLRPTGGTR